MIQTRFCVISFKVCLSDNCQQNYNLYKIYKITFRVKICSTDDW